MILLVFLLDSIVITNLCLIFPSILKFCHLFLLMINFSTKLISIFLLIIIIFIDINFIKIVLVLIHFVIKIFILLNQNFLYFLV